MEMDLQKLDWNPHTCECKLALTKETTSRMGHEEIASDTAVSPRGYLEPSSTGRDFVYRVPIYETVKVDLGGEVSKIRHPVLEAAPPAGTRIRATVTVPCPEHVGFTGVVQTQRVRIPQVCGCVWQELIIGQRKEGGFFGAFVERVCEEHKNLPRKDIRDTVIALSKELPVLDG